MNKKTLTAIGNCAASFLRLDWDGFLCYKTAKHFVDVYEREERGKHGLDESRCLHEQRHFAQAAPVNRNEERNKAFMALTDAIFTSGNITEVQQAAKAFVDICNREEREKPKRKWSSKKQRAYGKLLDCAIGRTTPEDICNAAIKLAQACKPEHEEHEQRHFAQAVPVNWSVEKDNAYHDLTEAIFKRKPLSTIQKAAITFVDICNREERKKPETGDVYRDIFGNKYIIVGVYDEEPIKKSFVMLIYSNAKGELSSSEFFTVPLEDFMNPTFKKV